MGGGKSINLGSVTEAISVTPGSPGTHCPNHGTHMILSTCYKPYALNLAPWTSLWQGKEGFRCYRVKAPDQLPAPMSGDWRMHNLLSPLEDRTALKAYCTLSPKDKSYKQGTHHSVLWTTLSRMFV